MAEDGRRQMFGQVNHLAGLAIGHLLAQMPSALSRVQELLQSGGYFDDVFRKLDVNGDGKVTFHEMLRVNGDNTETLGDLGMAIERAMHLGAGGEHWESLGVTLRMLQTDALMNNSLFFRAGITDGTSNTILLTEPAAIVQLPAVQLAGFCDGSVRKAGADNLRTTGGNLFASPVNRQFQGGIFFGDLAPFENAGWTGPITFNDGSGNGIIAILIGLLMPADRAGGMPVDGIVIATHGTGFFAGTPGAGRFSINFADQDFNGPFDASFATTPFIGPGRQ